MKFIKWLYFSVEAIDCSKTELFRIYGRKTVLHYTVKSRKLDSRRIYSVEGTRLINCWLLVLKWTTRWLRGCRKIISRYSAI